MEGCFWRFSHRDTGLVVVALCGICRDEAGTWAVVALATHPDRLLRQQICEPAGMDAGRFGVCAGQLLHASEDRLSIDLGPDAQLDVSFRDLSPWPRRAVGGLGMAHWLPALGQYWHPHLLSARADGEIRIGSERYSLDGARVYAEKNWGSAFPRRWWWGQAHDFERDDVCVAFAGGELGLGFSATAVVVRVGGELVRLSCPTAIVRTEADQARWQLTGRGPRHTVELEGVACGEPYALPVPIPAERRCEGWAHQQLAGRMWLRVRRGPHVVFEGETELAGLEYGDAREDPRGARST